VMYLGKLCEVGPGETVYREPLHPYTRALLDSVPGTEPKDRAVDAFGQGSRATTISGEPPSPIHPPSGCRFRTRCPRATGLCAAQEPPMRELASGHAVACHFPLVEPAGPAATGGPGCRAGQVSPAGAAGQVGSARTTVRSEGIEETPR
jgi:oligopeptide/dipeptide ABC transporter ATP-binding protein